MKHTAVFIILILISACGSTREQVPDLPTDMMPKEARNVLFIGNSYTHFNNMPETLRKLALSVNDTITYTLHAPSGAKISQHANSQELHTKINSAQWDFVSIQAQSQESALSEIYFEENLVPNVETLIDKVKARHSASIPLLFMTWGYENGDQSNCAALPHMCNYETMDNMITRRYTILAEATRSQLAPVGIVWRKIREQYPEIDLYTADGSHPSEIGSFAIATTFYTLIFKKDPSLLIYDHIPVDDDIEIIIKNLTKEVVFSQLKRWEFD